MPTTIKYDEKIINNLMSGYYEIVMLSKHDESLRCIFQELREEFKKKELELSQVKRHERERIIKIINRDWTGISTITKKMILLNIDVNEQRHLPKEDEKK